MIEFPELFELRMRQTLGADFEAFKSAYGQPVKVGLRVNTLKIKVSDFIEQFPYELKPIPWTRDGFYYDEEVSVAKHPYYHAGLFYVQEPSAMAPVGILAPQPREFCLDLCAAPGGKSMQIATAIKDEGLLVANDINGTRIKAVLRHAERFGLRNIIILNNEPKKIAEILPNMFDRVLVDAPCSGEGMFKKDPKAIHAWQAFGPEACADMQRSITKELPRLCNLSSVVVYSTCTFASIENEAQIAEMVKDGFALASIDAPEMDVDGATAKIWPHKHEGEGHFIGKVTYGDNNLSPFEKKIRAAANPPVAVAEFLDKHVQSERLNGAYELVKEKVYLRPEWEVNLKSLHVVREGLLVGELKKGRFAPSQALALYLNKAEFEPILDFSSESSEIIKYLKGETLHVEIGTEGLHLICTDGYPVGWGKVQNGTLKNMYPASWRML